MSMKRTCPISNFTSAVCSGGISSSLRRTNHLLHERFETRIAAEWVEQRIYFNPADVCAIVIGVILFQPAERLRVVAHAKVKQTTRVGRDVAVLADLV